MAKYKIRQKKAVMFAAFQHYLSTGEKGDYIIDDYGNGYYSICTKDCDYMKWYFVKQDKIAQLYRADIYRILKMMDYKWLYENEQDGPSYY